MRDLTIGNMRELAVRSLLVTCEPCRLGVVLTADDRPDLPLVVCKITTVSDGEIRDCSCFLCQEN